MRQFLLAAAVVSTLLASGDFLAAQNRLKQPEVLPPVEVEVINDTDEAETLPPGQVVVKRVLIGVMVEPVPEMLRAQVKIPKGAGVVVQATTPGSPAEKAGLEKFDIITAANGTPIDGIAALVDTVQNGGVEPVKLTLLRGGKEIELTMTPVLAEELPVTKNNSAIEVLQPEEMLDEVPGLPKEAREQINKMLAVTGSAATAKPELLTPEAINPVPLKSQAPKPAPRQAWQKAAPAQPVPQASEKIQATANSRRMNVRVTREGDHPAEALVERKDKRGNVEATWRVTEGDLAELPLAERREVERLMRYTKNPPLFGGAPKVQYNLVPGGPVTSQELRQLFRARALEQIRLDQLRLLQLRQEQLRLLQLRQR